MSGTAGWGASASGSYSQGSIRNDYASVIEQSGILAGSEGYQVKVEGTTTLTGGVIASSQSAIDNHKNSFDAKGGVTQSDIVNTETYSGHGFGISASNDATKITGVGAGIGGASGNQSSVTKAGIGVATEADTTGAITKSFDAQKVQAEINAQVTITQAFTQQASTAVKTYVQDQRQALQDQVKNAATEHEKQEAQALIKDLNTQERVLNILISAVAGTAGTAGAAIGKEVLSAAASEMRDLMIKDSKEFKGVTDGVTTLDNISGPSEGVRGDEVKVGGARVDLDGLCGRANERCLKNEDGSLRFNAKGQVQFNPEAAGNMSLAEHLQSPEGKKMSGPTGGIQGAKGTLFGIPYEAGSWQDKLIEVFSGSHDMIGGKLSGLYDEQGNATRGRSDATIKFHNTWSATGAIILSTPFSAAELLPPAVWQAVAVILKAAK